jgi:hypothetical protein
MFLINEKVKRVNFNAQNEVSPNNILKIKFTMSQLDS